ncbi:MAG: T9SS type A sorting domain-containing protein [Flavobacteriales bacterium]
MTRQFTTSVMAICVTTITAAQTFTTTLSDTMYISNVPLDIYTSHYIYVNNLSTEPLTMAWGNVLVDVPAGWEYSLCDIGICYIGIPSGATVAQDIAVGSAGYFGINLTPHSVGSGMVQINVWDTNFPEQKVLLTWFFSTGTVAVEENEPFAMVAYPNPCMDVVHIENNNNELFHCSFTDNTGKMVLNYSSNEKLIEMSTLGLACGWYHLVLATNNKSQVIKIQKQ